MPGPPSPAPTTRVRGRWPFWPGTDAANRATFSRIFGDELFEPERQARLKRQAGDSVIRFVPKATDLRRSRRRLWSDRSLHAAVADLRTRD